METRTADGKATGELIVEVADLKHLQRVTRSRGSVEGVPRVDRKYNIRWNTAWVAAAGAVGGPPLSYV